MPQIQNVSPLGDLDVPLLRRVVKAGEIVDVTDEHAAMLLPQDIWAAADKAAGEIQAKVYEAERLELDETDEGEGESE